MIEKDACYTDCVLKGVDCKSFVKLPVRIISDEPVRIDVLYWDGKEARIKSSKEVCYECDGNIKVEVV